MLWPMWYFEIFKTISFVKFVQTKDKNWNTNIINCIHWHEMIFLRNSSFLKWTQMTPCRFLRGLARCIWCWFHISIGFNPLLKVNFYPHQSPNQTSGQILNQRSWVKVDGLLGINLMIKTTKSRQSSKVNNAVIFLTAHFYSKDRSWTSWTVYSQANDRSVWLKTVCFKRDHPLSSDGQLVEIWTII